MALSQVQDYQLLIEHISRILRPGGLVELIEFDFHIYGRDQQRLNVSVDDPLGPPYWARYMAYLHRGVKKNGGDVDAANMLWRWLTGHSAFDNIKYRDVWIPSIPGNDERYSERVYPMMRENITVSIFMLTSTSAELYTHVNRPSCVLGNRCFDVLE